MKRDLQIVVKVAERCNINCSYCYYLNSGNESPHHRPPFISEGVARDVVRFVREGANHIDLGSLNIVLHGGEPLLLKKSRFRSICRILSEIRDLKPETTMGVTTNAMLIDDEWIEIFKEFRIGVAVSLDGPQEYHDLERVDFAGRGTYTRVMKGIERLQRAAAEMLPPGALVVIDPRCRGDVVYDHLVRKIGFQHVDFLVPMTIHDKNPKREDIEAVGRFLTDAFREWVRDDDPKIQIRIFNKYMSRLLRGPDERDVNPTHIIVGVGSDGTIVNDDLMQVVGSHIFDRSLNVSRHNMVDYLSEVTRGELAGVYESHSECLDCRWFSVCRPPTVPWSGAEMRYKRATGFKNKLVHCEAFQDLFDVMKGYIDASRVQTVEKQSSAGI